MNGKKNDWFSFPASIKSSQQCHSTLSVKTTFSLQNNAQPDPVAKVNGDDNKEATASKEEPSVQENQATESQPAQPAKKLTREERKMEAIMKAIEKMEKTEKRRQQALERIAVSKQQQQEKEGAAKSDETKSDQTASNAASGQDGEVNKGQAVKKDQQVLDSEQVVELIVSVL